MAYIKLTLREQKAGAKEGLIYFQVIHDRIVRQIKTDYRINENEWDKRREDIAREISVSGARREELRIIRENVLWERKKLEQIVKSYDDKYQSYTADAIISSYRNSIFGKDSVFAFLRQESERMRSLGRVRTGETYRQAVNSFMKFRKGLDLCFDMLEADIVEGYESYLRLNGLSRNTTSFYMRILRCIYNRAVDKGLTRHTNPFRHVYTGVDKTVKRAISLKDIKRIKELDLSGRPDLDYARDIFLLSFYMRGISFIDLAYLRKKDFSNGYIIYVRKKTGQKITIRWEKSMQDILDKYTANSTQYLLPIITRQDGTERKQYLNKILFVNRKLKHIAELAKIVTPLTLYVSRHSWASIASSKNIPMSVISKGMGHDNEETTRIYLASIQANLVDEANLLIMKEL